MPSDTWTRETGLATCNEIGRIVGGRENKRREQVRKN